MKRQKSRSSVKGGSWVRIMRVELQQIGLGNSWLEGKERDKICIADISY